MTALVAVTSLLTAVTLVGTGDGLVTVKAQLPPEATVAVPKAAPPVALTATVAPAVPVPATAS